MSGTSGWPSTPRLASARRPTEGRSSSPARPGQRSGTRHRLVSASAVSADIACPGFRWPRRSSRSGRRDCAQASRGRGSGAARPPAPLPDHLRPAGLEHRTKGSYGEMVPGACNAAMQPSAPVSGARRPPRADAVHAPRRRGRARDEGRTESGARQEARPSRRLHGS
jgi:hypothetical protein